MPLILIILLVVIALILIGWVVIGLTLKLLWWALVGLVIGALARLVLPGTQGISILRTILYGVGGALLGGIIANAIGVGTLIQFLIAIALAAALITLFEGSRRTSVA
jgi:uncharacterized membrane protein YeaQ/YmgE (transglycosylase-associated protein family)